MNLFRKILTTGRVAEPARELAPAAPGPDAGRKTAARAGSVQIRHVDAGSCNGCELEVASAFNPVYDGERFVASPRHADALLVTGPVTRKMAVAVLSALSVPTSCHWPA